MQTQYDLVESTDQAKNTIERFMHQGYIADQIFVLSNKAKDPMDHVNTIGNGMRIEEFLERGEALRAQIRSMGVSQTQAESLEDSLEEGYMVILAKDQHLDPYEDSNVLLHFYDRHI